MRNDLTEALPSRDGGRLTSVSRSRAEIERTLDFQIDRLARRVQPLQARSRQLSTVRLALALVGLLAVGAAAILLNGAAAWLTAALWLALFGGVVLLHRRLENWIETLTLLRALKLDQRARLQLDWNDLPPPRPLRLDAQGLAHDLDLTGYRSLHHLLDTTVSRRGTQLLAEWLTRARPDLRALTARQNIVRELVPRARFRERFQLTYRVVLKRELEGDNLLVWLKTEFPSRHLARTLPIAAALVVLNLILVALWYFGAFPPFWILSLVVYIAFYYRNQGTLETVLGAIGRVHAELEKFRTLVHYLEHASYASAPHLAALCAPFGDAANPPSRQLRRIGWITAAVGLRSNPLLAVLLNLILPWDFWFAFLADRERGRVAQTLPEWVRIVQELDALIALGNFAALNPEATFPEIRTDVQPVLFAQALGHPLIPASARVRNDFQVAALGEVEIFTGSNMAGKSTFLKTVGVNFCLAYAGAPVIASRFVAQPFRLHACIRVADSIADGFSYFYAEVKCLKALLEELNARDDLPLLYLIDEIFRGTNNRERLIGSRAYIHALLGARGIGLIATHDLELARLADANSAAHNYHFRDEVADGRLIFDYRLRAGACPTTNALKIMALEGLPVAGE